MLLGYDVAIQALNHDLGLISSVDHAVLAVVEADAFAYLGIAVFVLCEEGTEAAPAAKVAPAEFGGEGVDVFRFLHYSIIDADLVASGEKSAYYFFFFVGVERRCHLIHDGCELGLEGADGSADGVDVPHEDAGVPIVVASSKVVLGGGEVGLFLEGFYLIYLIHVRWLGSSYIAIACLWTAGLDANGNDGFFVSGIAECLAEDTLIFRSVNDEGIGGCHYNVCFRMFLLYLPTSIGDTWSGIASLRFGEDVVCRHVRDLLLDDAYVFLVGDHPHVLYRADGLQTVHGELDEGTSHAHDIDELFGVTWSGHGPEAATDAAGHDYYLCVGVIAHCFEFIIVVLTGIKP